MAKRRKKQKASEKESYEIDVDEWEVSNHFGINIDRNLLDQGDYWEDARLSLSGNIVSPILKNATKAKINIWENPEFDDHWKETSTEKVPLGIGSMEILRDNETLNLICWIPSRLYKNILLALASKKIKYASVFGEKLRWRRGKIFHIRLSTNREEE